MLKFFVGINQPLYFITPTQYLKHYLIDRVDISELVRLVSNCTNAKNHNSAAIKLMTVITNNCLKKYAYKLHEVKRFKKKTADQHYFSKSKRF